MKNKEFLAQFSRHLIRNAANFNFESKTNTSSVSETATTVESAFESEKRQAEEMMRRKFQIPQLTKMMPSIDISRIGDKEFAIHAPKLSEEEVSLRKELEKAKEKIMGGITAPPVVEGKKAVQPQPITETEIAFDLGKLNIFIKNPEITSIECNGPDKVIIIKKGTMPINTSTVLSKDEINDLIHKFSVATKTEITPIYKASYKNLMMTAFISPLIGTRFALIKSK